MVNRVKLSTGSWALRVSDGILVGKGAQVSYRLKSGQGVFDLWTAVRALLATGGQRMDELIQRLAPTFPVGVSRSVLPQFLRVGLLLPDFADEAGTQQRSELLEHPLWPYFERQSKTPAAHLTRLLEARIGVLAEQSLLSPLHEALGGNGLKSTRVLELDGQALPAHDRVAELAADSTLVVALAANPIRRLQAFPVINQINIKANRPWLAGHLHHDVIVLGPLFIPGETACFNCLELREENHLPNPQEYRELRGHIHELPATAGASPVSCAAVTLAQAVVMEIIRYASELAVPTTYRALVEMDLISFESSRHTLLRVPLCDVCGPHVDRPFRRSWSL